jgi:hypothetical protein
VANTCTDRIVGSWPIGRDALAGLNEYDSTGLPPWFLDFLDWLNRRFTDLLDNLVTFSDLHGNEGDAFRFPVSRTCPPDWGDLSASLDWQTADFDLMQYHVCYCEDQDGFTHIRLLGITLSTYVVEDPLNPGTYLYYPYVYAAKTPITSFYDPTTGEFTDCCAVPQQCFFTDGNLEALWGQRTMTVLALSPLSVLYPGGLALGNAWTAGTDVWGNAPVLEGNLDTLATVVSLTWNAVETLCEAFFYFLYTMAGCWDFNNFPALSTDPDCDGGGPG